MSNHLKYEDPTLSNQQAASATQLLQNGGNSKSKYLYSIKYIISYKKKYTGLLVMNIYTSLLLVNIIFLR
jgi:hypothetical protein